MATPLSVCKKKKEAKMVLLPEKKNGTRPTNPYIFRISVTRGMPSAYQYGHIPFCIKKTTTEMTLFPKKNNGATGLKLWHADTT